MIKYKIISILLKIHFYWKKVLIWHCQERNKKIIKSFGDGLKINGITNLTPQTSLGKYCNFNGLTIYGDGNVTIGSYFHSGVDVIIICQIHNYDKGVKIPYDDTYICQDVIIEDCVWIGSRVTILGGVTIGEGAIIQAGSTVVSDIPKYGIAGGHPAKVFKFRDAVHYEKLKSEGAFE